MPNPDSKMTNYSQTTGNYQPSKQVLEMIVNYAHRLTWRYAFVKSSIHIHYMISVGSTDTIEVVGVMTIRKA